MIEALQEHDYLEQKSEKEVKLEKELKEKSCKEKKLEKMVKRQALQLKKLKEKLRLEKQKTRRLKTKVNNLKELISGLKEKKLITENHATILNSKFSGVTQDLFNRIKNVKKGKGRKYSPLLRSFALTLQFYSTKAYNFVRRTFNLALPHQRQIRKWYSHIPAEPGFTEPSFREDAYIKIYAGINPSRPGPFS